MDGKWDVQATPTASTMTFQGQGCGDHLCQTRECGECVDDRFKPLLEFKWVDEFDVETLAKLRTLGWGPDRGDPAEYFDEDGDSLLHGAARLGEVEMMRKLLSMGARANTSCQGHCLCSPLMVACRWCHPDCARLLLDHSADVGHENSFGETAFDQVAKMAVRDDSDRELILALLRGPRN